MKSGYNAHGRFPEPLGDIPPTDCDGACWGEPDHLGH